MGPLIGLEYNPPPHPSPSLLLVFGCLVLLQLVFGCLDLLQLVFGCLVVFVQIKFLEMSFFFSLRLFLAFICESGDKKMAEVK